MKAEHITKATGRAYGAANSTYQRLTAPDLPLEVESAKKPWLAGLLTFAVVGAGQLYNRQLLKAAQLFLLTYVGGAIFLVVFLLLNHALMIGESTLPQWIRTMGSYVLALGPLLLVVWVLIWLFAVVDAIWIASSLRQGSLMIRYSIKRQLTYLAVGLIPFVGEWTPSEIVTPEVMKQTLGTATKEVVSTRIIRFLLVKVAGLGCLVVILIIALVMLLVAWLAG